MNRRRSASLSARSDRSLVITGVADVNEFQSEIVKLHLNQQIRNDEARRASAIAPLGESSDILSSLVAWVKTKIQTVAVTRGFFFPSLS